MSKKLTSFVLRLKKSHSWPVRNVSTVLAIFLLRSFTKLPKRKSLFQFQREEQRKKLKLYDPPSSQWCWIKIEKLHLEKAARPLMVCFLAATADEYLRASLKCIQIQKYGLSESVNSTTFSTCVCVCWWWLEWRSDLKYAENYFTAVNMRGNWRNVWDYDGDRLLRSHTRYQCSTGHFHAKPEVIEILNVWLQPTGKMWSSTTEAWLQIFQIYCICSRSVVRV